MNIVLFRPDEDRTRLSSSDDRTLHIKKVLRARPGDEIRCGILGENLYRATVAEMDEEGISLQPIRGSEEASVQPVQLRLAIGHPRPLVLQRLFRDLSSLGIAGIDIFTGELSEKSYMKSSLWKNPERYLMDGAMQGGITHIPDLHTHENLEALIPGVSSSEILFIADTPGSLSDEVYTCTLMEAAEVMKERGCRSAGIVIGPERGFSLHEREITKRFPRLVLGDTILRTEVAAGTAAVFLSQQLRRIEKDERTDC